MNESTPAAPKRKYHPRMVFVPREAEVDERHSAFRTHDGDIYIRTKEDGVIHRRHPKPKGKAARRAAREARRRAKAGATTT